MPDYELKSMMARVKAKPFHFALIKGVKKNQLYVATTPPSPKLLEPIYEECGSGKRIGGGICVLEDNIMTFAVKGTPSPAWEAMITKVLKAEQCSKYLPIKMRPIGAKESEESGTTEEETTDESSPTGVKKETEGETAPGETETSGDGGGLPAFMTRFNGLKPAIAQAIGSKTPRGEEIKKKTTEAANLARTKEFARANELLGQVEELLKAAPEVPTAPPQGGEDGMATFTNRLKALKPKLDKILTGGLPVATDVKLKASEAAMFARKKDFESANRLLDEVEKLMAQAPESTPPTSSDGEAEAALTNRIKALKPELDKVLTSGSPLAKEIKLRASEAVTFARKKEFEAASRLLDEVEKMMSQAAAGETGTEPTEESETNPWAEEATGPVYQGLVAYRKSLLAFDAAKKAVAGQIASLKSSIPSALPEEAELADEVVDTLQEMNDELSDTIDEAMNAAENKDSPVSREVQTRLKDYLGILASNPLVAHVDANPFVKVSVQKTLGDAITKIQHARGRLRNARLNPTEH